MRPSPILKIEENKPLIDLINYELRKKSYNIKLNYDFFDNFYEIFIISDVFKQEIILSIFDHYAFLKDKIYYLKFDEIRKIMEDLFKNIINRDDPNYRILKENDPLLLITWSFYAYNIEQVSLFYAVIIVKCLSASDFDKKNKYENSDFVLNKCVNYFERFLVFFHNSNNSGYKFFDKKQIRVHFFIIYEFLVKKKIIDSKIIWVKKKESLVTEKFWGIANFSYTSPITNFNIFISKPEIKTFMGRFFLVGGYYNKVFDIFRKNINSGLNFILNDNSLLEKLNNTEWFLEMGWFKEITEIMGVELGLTFETRIKLNTDLLNELNKCNWADIDLQKKYSENLYYLNIFDYYQYLIKLNLTTPIYFPFYFDFRGRIYYDSIVGITSCKLLRTVYYYGLYDDADLHQPIDERFDILIKKYSNAITETRRIYNIVLDSKKIDINILFILISIGKFTIIKNKYKIHMDEFVLEGLNSIIGISEKVKKFEDFVEILSYKKILINFKDKKKKIVVKDFTASFFQHLTRLLGPKNIIALELANMRNNLYWNDPYSYFIENFLENNKIENPTLFTRPFLKKTIMTIPYSIGNKSAWNYFATNLEEDLKSNKTIRKEYNLFFNYIKTMLEGDKFFKNSTDSIILYAVSKAFWFKNLEIKIGKSNVHLIYFKHKTKIIDLTIKFDKKTIRITKKINEIMENEIDFENIAISVRANWIAMMDGHTLRSLHKLMSRSLFTIHDCVLIDWLNIDNLIISCNEVLKENDIEEISWDNKHEFEIFSFFIIV